MEFNTNDVNVWSRHRRFCSGNRVKTVGLISFIVIGYLLIRANHILRTGERLAEEGVKIVYASLPLPWRETCLVTGINYVDLRRLTITNAMKSEIPRLTSLQRFYGGDSTIDDDNIEMLVPLGSLEELELANTAITDASVSVLLSFSHLQYLDIDGTLISSHGLGTLMQGLPYGCVVAYSDGLHYVSE